MDSLPPSNVVDALEFDLTIKDSDEVDCCEPVAQVPSVAQQELRSVPYTGRFAALIDDFDPSVEDPVPLGESDTDTVDGQSEADPEVVHEVEFVVPDVILEPLPSGHVGVGMTSLDEVDLNTIFIRRANVMRSIPHCLKGPCGAAVRLAMREASSAHETGDVLRLTRAWKLFLLLPRMFLSRPPRGGLVPKTRLMERVSLFHNGQWCDLDGELSGGIQSTVSARDCASVCGSPHAWWYRWRRMMACTAAKAFASSLLEHCSPVSAAGDIPSVHDVIRQDLHVR